MDEATVAAAIATLQTQGKEPSIGNLRKVLGHRSVRDITKHRKQLLPHMGRARRMDTTPVAETPVPPAQVHAPAGVPVAAVVEPAPTLLQEAETALQAARFAENRTKRDWDTAPRAERERLATAQLQAKHTREHAGTILEQRQRASARLRAEIPSARIASRRAQTELAVLEDEIRRRLLRARREAQQAQNDLDRMIKDLVSLAGPQAVPRED